MGKQNKRKLKVAEEPAEEDLHRFAGSSDEEENEDDTESSSDESNDHHDKNSSEDRLVPSKRKHEESESEGDESSEESEDDSTEPAAVSGMAGAMTKILGVAPKTGTASVILSKTITPLQRMAKQEKEKDKARREKRRMNRERNLASLHVPLSVATSRPNSEGNASGSLVRELEMERTHRRVATRGVVALFNAISQHQKKSEVDAGVSKQKSRTDVKQLTKHGFLDMIKSTAAKRTQAEEARSEYDESGKRKPQNHPASSATSSSVKPQWSALKDDYMLNPKLKDWDKESSDDDSMDDVRDEDLDGDDELTSNPKKKLHIGVR